MRGVGPVPVMSPMSKSFRKRERSSTTSKNNAKSTSAASPSKKPRLAATTTDCSIDQHHQQDQQQNLEQLRQDLPNESTTTSSPALSGASSLSTSNPKVGVASVSSPATPDRPPGQWSLRPRPSSGGVVKRTRRLYYDVNLTEDDATKILGHRIKVWWPLDNRWYIGEIKSYDSDLRQHWIIYDDKEREWIKLEKEIFRLQLLPGDNFERAVKPRSSTYCLNSVGEGGDGGGGSGGGGGGAAADDNDVCSRLDEQPSSRTASEDDSIAQDVMTAVTVPVPSASVGRPVSVVYSRRRHSRNGSRGSGSVPVTSAASTVETDTIEVQSPIRVCDPNTALSLEDQDGVSAAALEPELGMMEGIIEQEQETAELEMEMAEEMAAEQAEEQAADRMLVEGGSRDHSRDESVSVVKWPLSRNVAELLRFIEIRSRSRKGALVGGRLLNQLRRGTLPVWNIGDLFDVKQGPSTELLASGETTSSVTMGCPKSGTEASRAASLCMLISWNGFTVENNARLKELLETSLRRIQSEQKKQVFWKSTTMRRHFSVHTGSGSYLSLSVPSSGDHDPAAEMETDSDSLSDRQLCADIIESLPCSGPATELVLTTLIDGRHRCGSTNTLLGEAQEARLGSAKPGCAQTARVTSLAARSSSTGERAARMLLSKNLRKIARLRKFFPGKWDDLTGPGLRLSFDESLGLFSARLLPVLLRLQRLNSQAVLQLRASCCQVGGAAETLPESRPGLQELLSMSKKGRRTIKGIKRISQDEGLPLPPPKRIRIAIPEPPPAPPPPPPPPPSPPVDEQPDYCRSRGSGSGLKLEHDELLGDSDPEGSDDFDEKHRRVVEFEMSKADSAGASSSSSPVDGPCMANLLIVQSDRGWRETGAMVEQQNEGDSSLLVVSLNGEPLYTYKAYQAIQSGITNKHTHAVMWRTGKEWMLEFTDKMQWSYFRSMHAACCVANARALSVKHIPIPGVREVSYESTDPSAYFFRSRGNYIYHPCGEIEAALAGSKVFYDMDSEDEEWLRRHGDGITEESFEKTIHYLERAAYLQKQEISLPVAVELCSGIVPAEAIALIHSHWLERRRSLGMALLRCFQPSALERYEAAVKAWENSPKQTERPQQIAFGVRPNFGRKMKRRSSRRINPSDHHYLEDSPGLRNLIIPSFDSEFHSGSPGSDAYAIEDAVHAQRLVSRQRSRCRRPGRPRPRRTKSMAAAGGGADERKSIKTFIAPPTAVSFVPEDADPCDGGDSCSSMDFDLNDDALAKAQLARKAARIAASKAARAQELYAVADAAMKRAVACLIEAEALAAAEKAGRESAYMKLEQQEQLQQIQQMQLQELDVKMNLRLAAAAAEEVVEDDDDLLLPISNWTQEFGSGLIQKGDASVASPRKSLRYVNQSSLFNGMVS